MKKTLRRGIALFCCALSIFFTAQFLICDADYLPPEYEFAIDVVFVIDGSGSMQKSDPGPDSVAIEACKLFTDMCDYSHARAGFVVFNTKIAKSRDLTLLELSADRESIKKQFDSISYPEYGGTDISLGLTAAKDMLTSAGSFDGMHNPMIILLSDGETRDISKARKKVYDEELNDTVSFLEKNDTPVYSIALTANGNDFVDSVRTISAQTDGLFFETSQAKDLPDILSQIMAKQLRANLDGLYSFMGDGESKTVTIPIPNNSIYQANIIILSGKQVTDLHMKTPKGQEILLNSDSASMATSKCYTLIKLYRPEKGDWTLSLVGADQDDITINLLNSYDLDLSIEAEKFEYTRTENVKVNVFFNDIANRRLHDSDVFIGAQGELEIRNLATNEVRLMPLTVNLDELTAEINFDEIGTYELQAHVVGADGSFDKRTADGLVLTIQPVSLELLPDASDKYSFNLISPFLFLKYNCSDRIQLQECFSWDPKSDIEVASTPGEWEDVVEYAYNKETGEIVIDAVNAGNAEFELKIRDDFGGEQSIQIEVSVFPGWVIIAGAAILILIAAAALIVWRLSKRPILSGKITVSATLPEAKSHSTPPPAEIDLKLLNTKKRISLYQTITSSPAFKNMYETALLGISNYLDKVLLGSGDKKCTKIVVNIPIPPKGTQATVRNDQIKKLAKETMASGDTIELVIKQNEEVYRVLVTYKNSDFPSFDDGGIGLDQGLGGGFGQGFDSGGFGQSFDNGFNQGLGALSGFDSSSSAEPLPSFNPAGFNNAQNSFDVLGENQKPPRGGAGGLGGIKNDDFDGKSGDAGVAAGSQSETANSSNNSTNYGGFGGF